MAASQGDSTATAPYELAVKPPPNVVIPPPNVRENVAKTAEFVSRRGDVQLAQLRTRVGADPKSNLQFVLDDDPYNAYFLWYLQQLREGHGPAATQSTRPAADAKPKGPPEPPAFRFSARMPTISAKDLEVLKLTALYTARVGETWLKELRNRESGNFQFDFLRPNHSFFQFFRSLVEQYKILLDEDNASVEARIAELQRNIKNRFHILERAKARAEYVRHVTAQKEKEIKKAQDEHKEFASIDWHDFTVIATVLFDDADDAADLPPPALLNDLQSQSLEQKAMVSLSTRRLEEAMPDEQTYYNVSQQQHTVPPPMPAAPPNYAPMAPPVQAPYGAHVPPPPPEYRTPAQISREEEQARLARERQAETDQRARAQAAARGAPGRIVVDYVPRTAKKPNVTMAMCPNCKQQIPSNEMDEHIRSKCCALPILVLANVLFS